MKIQTIQYYFREVIYSMFRNRWMTFASIGTVAVSLFILGVFLILVMNINKMASSLESQVQISVYVSDTTNEDGRKDIERLTRAMKSVESVEYVPREKALKILRERLGDNAGILDALGDSNPLPNSFQVTVKNPDYVKKTANAIKALYGVEEVKYGQDVAANLFELTHLMRLFGLFLMALLIGATVFIISNTIRLTVFARRKEIAIMKYVGATDWFIRWPFVLEGIALGIIGGSLSALALRSFYSAMVAKIYDSLAFFPMVEQYPFMNYVTVALCVGGVLIGILGSTVSLKRFMEV
ncbi:MAG: permease-like cell division protein FtsX [Selenomonadaceae bacterium]|nr:permease-like cell division protein FtsX [Selenomonadaceae bacterium]